MEEILLINPAKKRKTSKRKAPAKRRRTRKTPVSKKRVTRRRRKSPVARRRRNPIARRGMGMRLIDNQIIPAAIGASGALVLDIAMGYANRMAPNMLTGGPMRHAIKGVAAILIGMGAEMVVKKRTASEMTKGALTVIMHDVAKETTQQFAPNIPLSEYVSGLGYHRSFERTDTAGFSGLGYTGHAETVGVENEMYNDLGEYVS